MEVVGVLGYKSAEEIKLKPFIDSLEVIITKNWGLTPERLFVQANSCPILKFFFETRDHNVSIDPVQF